MSVKHLIFEIIALAWFLLAGLFFVEKKEIPHWASTFFIYLVGAQWVFCGFFKMKMYAPYSGAVISPVDDNKFIRGFLFSVGFFCMYIGSVY